jgi:hypothetical protein
VHGEPLGWLRVSSCSGAAERDVSDGNGSPRGEFGEELRCGGGVTVDHASKRPGDPRNRMSQLAAVAARYGVEFLGPPRSQT